MKNDKMVNYYINRCIKDNLSVRQLEKIIKLKEYERLPEETKFKKADDNNNQLKDFVKDLPLKSFSASLLAVLILKNHIQGLKMY